jgi:hypothetical protein
MQVVEFATVVMPVASISRTHSRYVGVFGSGRMAAWYMASRRPETVAPRAGPVFGSPNRAERCGCALIKPGRIARLGNGCARSRPAAQWKVGNLSLRVWNMPHHSRTSIRKISPAANRLWRSWSRSRSKPAGRQSTFPPPVRRPRSMDFAVVGTVVDHEGVRLRFPVRAPGARRARAIGRIDVPLSASAGVMRIASKR